MLRLAGLLVVLLLGWAHAQPSAPGGVVLQYESTVLGRARLLKCAGAGVTCSLAGTTGTLTIPGGGGGGLSSCGTELANQIAFWSIAGSTLCGDTDLTFDGTHTTLQSWDKGGQVRSVKAFGAVGDNATNDTTAIQNAIIAANAEANGFCTAADVPYDCCTGAGTGVCGGTIAFPCGTYKITAPLKIDGTNAHWIGSGDCSTIRQFTAATSGIINGTAGRLFDVILENLRVDCQTGVTCDVGIDFTGISNSELRNVNVDLYPNGTAGFTTGVLFFSNGAIEGTGNRAYGLSVRAFAGASSVAVKISGTTMAFTANSTHIWGGDMRADSGTALLITGGDQCLIDGVLFQGTSLQAVKIQGDASSGQAHTVRGCRFEGVTNGILLDGAGTAAVGNLIEGNSYTSGMTTKVTDNGDRNLVIEQTASGGNALTFNNGTIQAGKQGTANSRFIGHGAEVFQARPTAGACTGGLWFAKGNGRMGWSNSCVSAGEEVLFGPASGGVVQLEAGALASNANAGNTVGFYAGTNTSSPRWAFGTGSPETVVTAGVGSFYNNTSGGVATSFYVKEGGGLSTTGWVAYRGSPPGSITQVPYNGGGSPPVWTAEPECTTCGPTWEDSAAGSPRRFSIVGNGAVTVRPDSAVDAVGGAVLQFTRSRGVIGARTGVLVDNQLGALTAAGHDTAGFPFTNASWEVNAAETFAVGAQGTYMDWKTTTIGTTANTRRMRLTDTGDLLLGSPTITPISGVRALVQNGHVALQNSDSVAREVRFYEPGTPGVNYTAFKSGTQTFDATFTWPTTAPPSGGLLTTSAAGILSWSTTAPPGGHNLLGASHTDTVAHAVVRGDLITGQSVTPFWTALAKGSDGQFLTGDGTDVLWSTVTLPRTSITSGGVLYASSTTAVLSSALLTDNALLVGGGAATAPNTLAAGVGVTNQLLHANTGAEPTWSAVDLASADVTGLLPPAKGGLGANNVATLGRYPRGDGTNFLTSAVAAAGAGACTNQFVRAGNDNAVPTCASVVLNTDTTGTLNVTNGGTGANLSATGGANQFVKQSGVGAAFTVGTIADADVPDTITLTNLTQITTRSHSDLQNLSADDHAQYTLRAGRTGATNDTTLTTSAGEGTLFGSSVTAGSLVLRANAADQTTGLIHLRGFSSLFSSYPTMAGTAIQSVVVFNPTTTISGTTGTAGGTTRVLDFSPTFTHSTRHGFYGVFAGGTFTQNIAPQQSTFLLFAGQPTLTAGTSGPMGPIIFYAAPTQSITTGLTTSGGTIFTATGLGAAPAITVSGSSTWLEHNTIAAQDAPSYTIGAGSYLKDFRQTVLVADPIISNAGTFRLTDNVGMDVATLAAGDANVAVRSMGGSVESRHKGPFVSTASWSYLKLAALPTPTGAPIVNVRGTTGATTWTYTVTAVTPNGETPASPTGTTTTGNATLTGSNFNRIMWPAVPGATSYNIYRTVAGGTPSSTGKIGSFDIYSSTQQQFDDTGLAGSGTSPTTNTTGLLEANVAQKVKRTATAASYTTLQSDYLIGVTSTAAARTITLVPVATAAAGLVQIVKDESGGAFTNNITVDGNASELIDGSLTKVITTNYGALRLYTDGSNWFTW